MAKIVILGAGVMGSALTVPATDNGHQVTLVGTHLDRAIIDALRAGAHHPKLEAPLPSSISPIHIDALSADTLQDADVLIVGVSSPGINWAREQLSRLGVVPALVALVTKGLETNGDGAPLTYAQTMQDLELVGIGGPCIAREIAFRQPTSVVYASRTEGTRSTLSAMMRSPSYLVHDSADLQGVEACAALKNFLTIGVSASMGPYAMHKGSNKSLAKNPTAALFNQAVRELAVLCEWLGGERDTAFDLAGLGDLHVTVGGGRNSRLGMLLGRGQTVQQALSGDLSGETVEGVDTGRALAAGFNAAVSRGTLTIDQLPLTHAILEAIEKSTPFAFNYELLGRKREI